MTALLISLFFGVAAFAALAVIRASIMTGAARAWQILAELSAIERAAGRPVSRMQRPGLRPAAFRPRCAAA